MANTPKIKAGDVFTFRNTKSDGKGGAPFSYENGVYLAMGDEIGDFFPAYKLDMSKADYFAGTAKSFDRKDGVFKLIGEEGEELVYKFIAYLGNLVTLPERYRAEGKKLPYIESVYSRAGDVLLQLKLEMPRFFESRPIVMTVEETAEAENDILDYGEVTVVIRSTLPIEKRDAIESVLDVILDV